MSKHNKTLILTIYGDYHRRVPYYIGLVNYLKLINKRLNVLIVVSSTECFFSGKLKYRKTKNYETFGIDKMDLKTTDKVYNFYKKIPHNKIIICPNKGWDIGPLYVGLNYMYMHSDIPEYIINIHSKTNVEWERSLTKISHYNASDFNVDTIVPARWNSPVYTADNISSKLNIDKILTLKDIIIGPDYSNIKNWDYIGGKMFITKTEYLKPIVESFDTIYPMLTDSRTDDKFWVDAVSNEKIFNYYYNLYKYNPWNEPINHKAFHARVHLKCKNYFELLNHGYRSIPDLMIEHALERIIGHLILNNSDRILDV